MTNKQAAIEIIKCLRGNGFRALLAGGCVRDMLLGRIAKDFDVATSAEPKQIIKLFKRTLKVGAKFGVIIVIIEDQQVEVATFRTEAGYTDGRHPDQVTFASAAEDAGRRDFTVNGMFYDPLEKEVIDHVNGRGDLKSGIIRTIGKAEQRFGEDYLRLLRAVRFSTQVGFAIEARAWLGICKAAKYITEISGERIAMELEGILADPNRAAGAGKLIESGLADEIFPGSSSDKKRFAVEVLGQLPKRIDFALGLAGFFAGSRTEFAVEKCRMLKLSRNRNRHVKFLLTNRGKLLDKEMSLAKLKMLLAEPYFDDLYQLQRAIQKAQGKSTAALRSLKKRIKELGDVELKPKPLLDGHELIGLGAVAGPSVGQLAAELYIAQLEGQLKTKTHAKKWAQKWLAGHKGI